MSCCACGEPLQRLPTGEMPDQCYHCMGGTRQLRARADPPVEVRVGERRVDHVTGEILDTRDLTDEQRRTGLAGIRRARAERARAAGTAQAPDG